MKVRTILIVLSVIFLLTSCVDEEKVVKEYMILYSDTEVKVDALIYDNVSDSLSHLLISAIAEDIYQPLTDLYLARANLSMYLGVNPDGSQFDFDRYPEDFPEREICQNDSNVYIDFGMDPIKKTLKEKRRVKELIEILKIEINKYEEIKKILKESVIKTDFFIYPGADTLRYAAYPGYYG